MDIQCQFYTTELIMAATLNRSTQKCIPVNGFNSQENVFRIEDIGLHSRKKNVPFLTMKPSQRLSTHGLGGWVTFLWGEPNPSLEGFLAINPVHKNKNR